MIKSYLSILRGLEDDQAVWIIHPSDLMKEAAGILTDNAEHFSNFWSIHEVDSMDDQGQLGWLVLWLVAADLWFFLGREVVSVDVHIELVVEVFCDFFLQPKILSDECSFESHLGQGQDHFKTAVAKGSFIDDSRVPGLLLHLLLQRLFLVIIQDADGMLKGAELASWRGRLLKHWLF